MTESIFSSIVTKYLCCSVCHSDLVVSKKSLRCKKCSIEYPFIYDSIPCMLPDINKTTLDTMQKWDNLYVEEAYNLATEKKYKDYFLKNTLRQLLEYFKSRSKSRSYLELGVGLGCIGESLATEDWFFVGIDFSKSALLRLKKKLDRKGIKNYLLVMGDIQKLPFKDNVFDLIFGGGVIEHFPDATNVIQRCYQTLKKNGVIFNTIPPLNIGNIIYRSQWGSIPDFPILKQVCEFIHLKVLKGVHMVFGYELMLTKHKLVGMHKLAGFVSENIIFDRYEIKPELNIIKNKILKSFFVYLCENSSSFWPAVKIIGIKK